jgi:hypothetical protein
MNILTFAVVAVECYSLQRSSHLNRVVNNLALLDFHHRAMFVRNFVAPAIPSSIRSLISLFFIYLFAMLHALRFYCFATVVYYSLELSSNLLLRPPE